MIKQIKNKRKLLIFAIIIVYVGVITAGYLNLSHKGQEAVHNLSFQQLMCDEEFNKHGIGSIVDSKGQELWGPQFSGYEDTYNVVGKDGLSGNPVANSVMAVYRDDLYSLDGFNIFQGMKGTYRSRQNVELTIDHEVNEKIYNYMKENGVKTGSIAVMDADTGAVPVLVSLPAMHPDGNPDEAADGSLLNRNLLTVQPGSTMKVFTAALLEQQPGFDDTKTSYCSGKKIKSSGDIICLTGTGEIDLSTALGISCNTYIADNVEHYLDRNYEEVCSQLNRLGIRQENGTDNFSGLVREASTTGYDGSGSFLSDWSMIGQGSTLICPLNALEFTSALTNGGQGTVPYLVERIYKTENDTASYLHEKETKDMLPEDVAERVYSQWKAGFDANYSDEYQGITISKTGTTESQQNSGSALLMGYLEEENLVFFVEICDYQSCAISPVDVVNELNTILKDGR